MVQVVAALIRDGDKFMIFQRPVTKTRAYQWEFVGGKVERGSDVISFSYGGKKLDLNFKEGERKQ